MFSQWVQLEPPQIYIFDLIFFHSNLELNLFKRSTCAATAGKLQNRYNNGVCEAWMQHINDASSSKLQLTLSLWMNEAPSWQMVLSSILEWIEHGGKEGPGNNNNKKNRRVFVWRWVTHSPRCSMKAEQNERRSEVMHVGVSWIQQCRKFSLNELEPSRLLFQILSLSLSEGSVSHQGKRSLSMKLRGTWETHLHPFSDLKLHLSKLTRYVNQ